MKAEADSPSAHDRETLRRLGEEIARIGNFPIQQERAELWRRLNDREPVRPLVYINEEPWPELECEALACICEDSFLRDIERTLRRTLYRWHNHPGDMVVSPVIDCHKVFESSGIGLSQKGNSIAHSSVRSQHFEPQITSLADIEKISMPVVAYNADETARRLALLGRIFDGILPVKLRGCRHVWFTPWDNLIRLVDIETVMLQLVDEPGFVDAMVSRYVDALTHELDQLERLGLLDAGAANVRIGSGGYGYTRELPAESDNPEPCANLWGCGNAQIFSEVSPDMHWEFSLKHEMRWLARWGLVYYGCCEPLHRKIDILRRIPNLRKISVSPWFDIEQGLAMGAGDYILSVKPNPSIFAEDRFDEGRARSEIHRLLDLTRGCQVELVMKDISTLRNDPSRLARWATIAHEEVGA